ncbi:MAG: hypothetical protein AB2A00_42920 [Myxococcota bacterium]
MTVLKLPLGLRAANDDELELDGRSLLRGLWEQPNLFSRNRHFEALGTPDARAARRELKLCRSVLADLRSPALTGARLERGAQGVKLVMQWLRASREVRLSTEAFELLLAHPSAARLRELLAAEGHPVKTG